MKTLFRVLFAFFIIYAPMSVANLPPSWYSKSTDNHVLINVILFFSSTCPHCQKADAFFREIESKSPELSVQYNFIDQDKNALVRFSRLLNEQQMNDFAVPSIYFCDSRWIGFDSAATTGKNLLEAIQYCRKQIQHRGTLTKATVDTLRHWANANQFTSGMIEKPSALNYTITIAFMDAFNPCAFFCFSGFLAFLLITKQRKKHLISCFLFIFSILIVHYTQQVYTNHYFEWLPLLRFPAVLLGLMAIYFVRQYYKKQPNDTLYFLLAFFLGLVTMVYQQTCVMNWSTIFEQWLNNQYLSNWQSGFYQLLYQGIYILPLITILCAYLGLLKIERFAILRTQFTRIGLLLLTAIALCLIAYPVILSDFTTSLLILLILVVCGFFINLT